MEECFGKTIYNSYSPKTISYELYCELKVNLTSTQKLLYNALRFSNVIEEIKPKPFSLNSANIVKALNNRQLYSSFPEKKFIQNFGAQNMIFSKLYKEYPIQLNANKIFCSLWLSDEKIIMGTKCNNILLYNTVKRQVFRIPCLTKSDNSPGCVNGYGIRAIAVNPSRTKLVTGANTSNNLAVYSLPYFEPFCVCEQGHSDCVFDLAWIDDEFFVSCARDGKIIMWHASEDETFKKRKLKKPRHIKPLKTFPSLGDNVRAIYINSPYELVSINLNGYVDLWDLRVCEKILTERVPHHQENVCLAYNKERKLYAVGSAKCVTLISGFDLKFIKNIYTSELECSIRSLQFQNDILSFGTGTGKIYFYDLKEKDFAMTWLSIKNTRSQDENYTAIYTHCYNLSGTKLFTAGGPLSISSSGNYAAIWQ